VARSVSSSPSRSATPCLAVPSLGSFIYPVVLPPSPFCWKVKKKSARRWRCTCFPPLLLIRESYNIIFLFPTPFSLGGGPWGAPRIAFFFISPRAGRSFFFFPFSFFFPRSYIRFLFPPVERDKFSSLLKKNSFFSQSFPQSRGALFPFEG